MKVLSLVVVLAPVTLTGAALARQPPPLHDIPWYIAHPAEANTTVNWCRLSVDRSRLADCQNAEASQNAQAATKNPRDPLAMFNTPEYFAQHPFGREMVRHACANPTAPGSQPYLWMCKAAR